jgi:phosphoglycerol geranylgeranyltransferase
LQGNIKNNYTVLQRLKISFSKNSKQLALLIDPDKQPPSEAALRACQAEMFGADYVFIGGSLLCGSLAETAAAIKQSCRLPLVIFPGHASHLCHQADAVLMLSLVSGRNPEFLIGNHVVAAPQIKRLGLQPISCGYMLVGSGLPTSVEYMSGTRPIPAGKTDIAAATAMAAEMLGMSCVYIEGGSGAGQCPGAEMIKAVAASISIPIIAGGGIDSPAKLQQAYQAGASVAVIGTAVENNPEVLADFCNAKKTLLI